MKIYAVEEQMRMT